MKPSTRLTAASFALAAVAGLAIGTSQATGAELRDDKVSATVTAVRTDTGLCTLKWSASNLIPGEYYVVALYPGERPTGESSDWPGESLGWFWEYASTRGTIRATPTFDAASAVGVTNFTAILYLQNTTVGSARDISVANRCN